MACCRLKASHLDCVINNKEASEFIRPRNKNTNSPFTMEMNKTLEKYMNEIRSIMKDQHDVTEVTF